MKRFKPFLLLLAIVGLLWACETTDPFVNEVQIGILTGNFESALAATEQAIEVNPENYVAHYYKGLVLASQAEIIEIAKDRQPLYARAIESFDTAKEIMGNLEETPSELEELNNSIISFWADEYNMGVNIQNDDSLFNATPDPFRVSLAHFDNAATINPDSAMTYQVMSSTHFQMNEIENAISTYEVAIGLMRQPQIDDYEYLISLYLYNNQYTEAIAMSNRAIQDYPDEAVFVQFLADAYIQQGDRDRAIELIQSLIASDPDNPQYRRVLGTQIYQSVDRITSEISGLYQRQFDLRQVARNQRGQELEETQSQIDQLSTQVDEREREIDELTLISIREMEKVIELEPESESANFILGIIYQNRAANLFERRNNTTDNQVAMQYDDRARENLRQALKYYERAAELNPDNPENWQSLFQVYTTLGMEEEAQEAMRKAGFDD